MDLLESQKLYHKTMKQEFHLKIGGICMKSHTEKHKVKLNPCKYCGETEVEIIYNRFNNQEHCVAQCKCGAYVQRYCINTLLAPELEKTVIAIWNNGNISKPL